MKKPIDWEGIEREYRAGQLTVSEIARQYGLSHTAINKRAKKDAWKRDLTHRVRAEVSARLVSDEVSNANAEEAVETAAARGVELVRQHRRALGRAAATVDKLQAELDRATDRIDEVADAIEQETAEDKTAQRRNSLLKATSLSARASTALALSQTLKNLIPLERQAFNLQDEGDVGDSITVEITRFADQTAE